MFPRRGEGGTRFPLRVGCIPFWHCSLHHHIPSPYPHFCNLRSLHWRNRYLHVYTCTTINNSHHVGLQCSPACSIMEDLGSTWRAGLVRWKQNQIYTFLIACSSTLLATRLMLVRVWVRCTFMWSWRISLDLRKCSFCINTIDMQLQQCILRAPTVIVLQHIKYDT